MKSASFGRRVVELPGRELVLVPGKAPGPSVDLSGREELKERIRGALMSRIDPSGGEGRRSPIGATASLPETKTAPHR